MDGRFHSWESYVGSARVSRTGFCLEMRAKYPETSSIHPTVIIPLWVKLGKNVSIREGCLIGTQGFGFEEVDSIQLHIPHIGGVIIGDDVEIFEYTIVCRGTVDNTIIGSGTKIDVLCHVAHNVKIGENCLIPSGCILGGSSEVGDHVFIGSNSTLKDHVKIASNVIIGCGSNVVKDITEENTIWAGNPAKFIRGR